MARFKCVASGCTAISDRRRAPSTCLDQDRCQFEEFDAAPLVAQPSPVPSLLLTIGTQTFPIESLTVLGRNGDLALDVFRADLSVSRRHCELVPQNGAWSVNALSAASPTTLDGTCLLPNSPIPLTRPRHELGVGGTLRLDLRLALPATAEPLEFSGELDDFLKNE